MDVALVSTVNLAVIYALVAVGISLTWAGLGFLNLAHGVTFATAGYGAWWTSKHISGSGPAMLAAGLIVGALAGALIWLLVFFPLDGRPNFETRSLIMTLALSLVGVHTLLEVFGPQLKELPAIFGESAFRVGGTVITADKSGAVLSGGVVLCLLLAWLRRSRNGLALRALAQNREGAELVGIDRRSLALAVLALSGALAGLASVLLSQTFFVSSGSGFVPLVKGLIVALLGGLGSVTGTVIAAVLVGATEAFTATYIGGQYVLMTQFALIATVLLVRPRGVAGILETTRA